MKIQIDMPSPLEAAWKLLDENGGEITSGEEYPHAKLVFTPNFYASTTPQICGMVQVVGKSGRTERQVLKVSPVSGKLSTAPVGQGPRAIVPLFDKARKPKKETPHGG